MIRITENGKTVLLATQHMVGRATGNPPFVSVSATGEHGDKLYVTLPGRSLIIEYAEEGAA